MSSMTSEMQTANENTTKASKSKKKGDIEKGVQNDSSVATGRMVSASFLWFIAAIILIVGALSAASIIKMFLHFKSENAQLRWKLDQALADSESKENSFNQVVKSLRDDIKIQNVKLSALDQDVGRQLYDHRREIIQINGKIRGPSIRQIDIEISRIYDHNEDIDAKTDRLQEQLDEIMTNSKQIEQKVLSVNSTLEQKVESLRTLLAELNDETASTGTDNVAASTTPASTSTLGSINYDSPESDEYFEQLTKL